MHKLLAILVCFLGVHLKAQTAFAIENNELKLPSPIVFKTGTAELKTEESKAALEHIKFYLEAKSYITMMRIEGHVSSNGKSQDEQTLSEQRAKAVYDWLINNGVDCKRLMAVGFGSTKPLADNSNPEGRSQNNRISLINAELRNKAIGGMPLDGGGNVIKTCR